MRKGPEAHELRRQVQARLRMIQHCEQVTRNVCRPCRFFGISRAQFYVWLGRYRAERVAGSRDRQRGPRQHPFRTPPHIVGLILKLRRERQYGAARLSFFLERYRQVYASAPLSTGEQHATEGRAGQGISGCPYRRGNREGPSPPSGGGAGTAGVGQCASAEGT